MNTFKRSKKASENTDYLDALVPLVDGMIKSLENTGLTGALTASVEKAVLCLNSLKKDIHAECKKILIRENAVPLKEAVNPKFQKGQIVQFMFSEPLNIHPYRQHHENVCYHFGLTENKEMRHGLMLGEYVRVIDHARHNETEKNVYAVQRGMGEIVVFFEHGLRHFDWKEREEQEENEKLNQNNG
jgi:hypothetical protein